MKACEVDEQKLAEWIDGATGAIWYLGPAITEKLAQRNLPPRSVRANPAMW